MNKFVPWFIILLGLNFLAGNFGLPNVDLGDVAKLWPLALVWVGWNMLKDRDNDAKWEAQAEAHMRRGESTPPRETDVQ
ncbi:MAG TPA: hypothetical protein P5571_15055 [Candidatus Krumholzibacteria bacterium]|nr:hypothetical protein [Candidatus Krumholzibacteria bacterium]HRX52686.1 hypothetical protein [Candidatus Krumholzibacteria bacterium]